MTNICLYEYPSKIHTAVITQYAVIDVNKLRFFLENCQIFILRWFLPEMHTIWKIINRVTVLHLLQMYVQVFV